jgi:hypothetical protein
VVIGGRRIATSSVLPAWGGRRWGGDSSGPEIVSITGDYLVYSVMGTSEPRQCESPDYVELIIIDTKLIIDARALIILELEPPR